jgi:O-antigen/teichoic acid export membrane protein
MANSIGKSSLFSLLATWLYMPVGIITGVIIARVLGPELKGQYSIFLATQGLLLIPGFAVQSALMHFVARNHPDLDELKRVINWLVLLQATLSVVLLAIFLQVPQVRSVMFGGLDPVYLLAVFGTVSCTLWVYYRSAIILGLEMWVKFHFWSTVGLFITNGLLIAFFGLWWLAGWVVELPEVVAVTLFATLVVAGMWRVVTSKVGIEGGKPFNRRQMGSVVTKFATPMLIRNGLEWMNYSAGIYFLNAFAGAGAVGIYTVAMGLAQQLWLVPASIAGPLFTRVSTEGDTPASRVMTRYAFRVMLLISLALAGLVGVVASTLIPLVYGHRFEGAVQLVFALLPGVIAIGPTKAIVAFLAGSTRPGEPLRAELVGLLGILTFNALLVPGLGGLGAALAMSGGYILFAAFLCYRFIVLTDSRWADLFVFRRGDVVSIRDRVSSLARGVLNVRGWRRSLRHAIGSKGS